MTTVDAVDVRPVAVPDLTKPLRFLEQSVRDGEPVPRNFAGLLRKEVERDNIEVLAAYLDDSIVGVVVLAFRPSISVGSCFASIEELYVKPEVRRRGVGRALLEAAEQRFASKDASYVEVQAVEKVAVSFYRALGYRLEDEVHVLSRSVALRKADN